MRIVASLLLWFCLGLALPAQALDESDLLPVDEAFVLSHAVGADGTISVHWAIADGYYLYKHRFGAQPVDPAAFALDGLDLPAGIPKSDEFFGDTEIFREQVTGTVRGRALIDGEIEFKIRYQGCADLGICYPPQTRSLKLALTAASPASTPANALPGNPAPAGFNPLQAPAGKPLIAPTGLQVAPVESTPLPAEQAFGFEAIAVSPSALLLRFTPAPGYYLYRDRSKLQVIRGDGIALQAPQWPEATPHVDEHFGDVAVYFEQVEVPLPLSRSQRDAQTVELEVEFQGCQTDGICYPPMQRRVSVELPALPPGAATADASTGSEWTIAATLSALLAAIAGGLILNLMPCVLPVLSLKVLGVAGSGENAAKARAHALWYTAGVLVSFAAVGLAALALRSAGLALGWGFQLQQPLVVAALTLVMFAVGLSLSGVFQIGTGITGIGQSLTEKQGAAGDFFTGVLAVVVATPCTAPFMGGALAFAFTAPTALAVAVFLALGLGLALPFLLIGFVPALARALPRPGAWMDTFKQVLAFPMYLTAVWLAWVLAKQRGADAIGWVLIAAVCVAAAAWAWNHWQLRRGRAALLFCLLAVGAAAASLVGLQQMPAPTPTERSDSLAADGSVAYSAEALAALRRDQRVVFVNMTADWCVTCKANEKAVLSQPAFKEALQAANAVYMKGDWTNVDPAITAFLEDHGAVGVPLYVVFGSDGSDGVKLPTVLTDRLVSEALSNASR